MYSVQISKRGDRFVTVSTIVTSPGRNVFPEPRAVAALHERSGERKQPTWLVIKCINIPWSDPIEKKYLFRVTEAAKIREGRLFKIILFPFVTICILATKKREKG